MPDVITGPAPIEGATRASDALQTYLRGLLNDSVTELTVYQPDQPNAPDTPLHAAFDAQPYLVGVLSVPAGDDEPFARTRLDNAVDTLRIAVREEAAAEFSGTAFANRQRLLAPLIDEIPQLALELP